MSSDIRLTVQVQVARGVVKIRDDWLDVVEGHCSESVVPEVEEVEARSAGQEVRLETDEFVVAQLQFSQVSHTVEGLLGYVLDLILIEFELSEFGHLDEAPIADHRYEIAAKIEPRQASQAVETVARYDGNLIAIELELLERRQVLESLVVKSCYVVAI